MHETMLLHLEELNESLSGGALYVTIGETAFPEEGWYDRVAADLENWVPAICSFARGHADVCVLQFMDGPCQLRLERQESTVTASCLWDHHVRGLPVQIDFPAFLQSVCKCIRYYQRSLFECGKPLEFQEELSALKNTYKSF